jgi:hypothetical protein
MNYDWPSERVMLAVNAINTAAQDIGRARSSNSANAATQAAQSALTELLSAIRELIDAAKATPPENMGDYEDREEILAALVVFAAKVAQDQGTHPMETLTTYGRVLYDEAMAEALRSLVEKLRVKSSEFTERGLNHDDLETMAKRIFPNRPDRKRWLADELFGPRRATMDGVLRAFRSLSKEDQVRAQEILLANRGEKTRMAVPTLMPSIGRKRS